MQCPRCGKESKTKITYLDKIEWHGAHQTIILGGGGKAVQDMSLHSKTYAHMGGCFFWPLVILLSIGLWVGTLSLFNFICYLGLNDAFNNIGSVNPFLLLGILLLLIILWLVIPPIAVFLLIKRGFDALKIKRGEYTEVTWRCKHCGYTERQY